MEKNKTRCKYVGNTRENTGIFSSETPVYVYCCTWVLPIIGRKQDNHSPAVVVFNDTLMSKNDRKIPFKDIQLRVSDSHLFFIFN